MFVSFTMCIGVGFNKVIDFDDKLWIVIYLGDENL